MSNCAGRTKGRPLFRSNSSCGSVFGKIDNKISRTFSLSSSEADHHDDECRRTESFDDEEENLLETNINNIHRPVPDLRVPLEKAPFPRKASGFPLETMIRRDETKTRFIMFLQSTTAAVPIFCAQKYPPSDGGQILIKSMNCEAKRKYMQSSYHHHSSNAATFLGSLVKKKKKKASKKKTCPYTTTYELVLHEETANGVASATSSSSADVPPTTSSSNNDLCSIMSYKPKKRPSPLVVATIEYEQVSKARYLLEGAKPRRARVSILGRESVSAETRVPNQESNGQNVLDFGGRGLETSSKNTQLVARIVDGTRGGGDHRDDKWNDECCLQMVKWKDHEFNVDFGAPFDAFHAFAFALAQFDF